MCGVWVRVHVYVCVYALFMCTHVCVGVYVCMFMDAMCMAVLDA